MLRTSILALSLAACGTSSSDDTPIGAFCNTLAAAPDCATADVCEMRFQTGEVTNPRCVALYDQFAGCLSTLSLACVQHPDFIIHAAGDGTPPPDYIGGVMPIYLFDVKDAACEKTGRDLATCAYCSAATGYPGGRGVGDRCSTSSPCASGLTCNAGMCTKPCTNSIDCLGTTDTPNSCQNEFHIDNVCAQGMCSSKAEGGNGVCTSYGPGWTTGGAGLYCVHP